MNYPDNYPDYLTLVTVRKQNPNGFEVQKVALHPMYGVTVNKALYYAGFTGFFDSNKITVNNIECHNIYDQELVKGDEVSIWMEPPTTLRATEPTPKPEPEPQSIVREPGYYWIRYDGSIVWCIKYNDGTDNKPWEDGGDYAYEDDEYAEIDPKRIVREMSQ